ncbi:CC178 protein, partial [Galbula dea]|nr:CC178 protein [Galbula dea]
MFGTQSFSCSSVGSNEPSQDKKEQILTRQHSCALVNTPLPCVNKAVHHIQELQLKMEKFFQQYDYVFKEEKTPWVAAFLQQFLFGRSLGMRTKIEDPYGKTLTLKQETEALLLEVTELINRLEAEREEAQKALELEKQRRKKLSMKIDAMSIWRLQEVSAAVQKEYEMCMQDILELQWHLECKRCQQRQVQTQILETEADSRKIQEDVDFMKKHSPLLEEKLNLEGEALKAVLLAYEK